jgi:hypothetical protein
VVGTSLYVASNGALGAGLSAAGNIVTQEMATGAIDMGQLKVSAELGFAFGGLSGGYGVWINSINASASQTAGQLAFASSGAAYFLGASDATTEATDALAAQVWTNAAFRMGMIAGVDSTVSPWVQFGLESQVDAALERPPTGRNNGSSVGDINIQQDPTGKYSKPVSAY